MRYTITRADGRTIAAEWGPDSPPGYSVTEPAVPGLVTEIHAPDLIGRMFALADDAAREIATARERLAAAHARDLDA